MPLSSRVAAEVQLTNKDPRWVGAWWLGFLVAASLVALSALPYFFFPREMPKEVGEVLHTHLQMSGTTDTSVPWGGKGAVPDCHD